MAHRTRSVAALAALTLAAGVVFTSPAAAAPASKATYLHSTPTWSSKDAECDGKHAKPCDLGNDLIRRFDALHRGARVTVVLYSSTRAAVWQALDRAGRRGVKITLMTSHPKPNGEDSDDVSAQVEQLERTLTKQGQRVVVGWGSLSRGGAHGKAYRAGKDDAGLEHRKLVLIDPDGRLNGNEVTISDSGNWTYSLDTAWNDRMVITDRCLYAGLNSHLTKKVAADRQIGKTGAFQTCDHKRKVWMMPESKVDPVLGWAQKARCERGAVVTLSNFYFAGGKAEDMADELIRLRRAGAAVRVAANEEGRHWSASQRTRMARAHVEVVDVDNGAVYGHQKNLAAVGCKGGSFSSQGSTTMNKTAYAYNGNQVVTSTVLADARAIQAGFGAMVKDRPRA